MDLSDPQAVATAPYGGGREPQPPSWDGTEPIVNFPVFEKNVKYWEFESEIEEVKRGVRLLRGLTGVARAACDALEFEQVAHKDGVKNILGCLREQFAPHLEVSLPRAFEKAIYGPPRSHKENMQEYLIRAERAFFLLGKEGVTLPDNAVGYVLYRQASLTESQELRFGAWAQGKYDKKTVISCLRKLDKVIADSKSKGAGAFVQEGDPEDAGQIEEDVYLNAGGGADSPEDDQWIYVEEGDLDKIFEEEELQVVLATYQEVRKAIQSTQKGRQFWKGQGRGSPGQDYFRNKKKVHIEQLKLRTRCSRCGTIGHWAKECRNQPDQRGRQFQSSAVSSKAASVASSKPSSTSGQSQSWYVASDAQGVLQEVESNSFVMWCGGFHTRPWSFTSGKGVVSFGQDETRLHDHLRGQGLILGKVDPSRAERCSFDCSHFFVGLTTSPTSAVVDTAAQDGLVGRAALNRLKQQLDVRGLRVVWTEKKARAHGVGGPAKVIGTAAIPVGLAGSTGILEATVVESDVPLLLPVKLLKNLRAVIDVDGECMHFQSLNQTVPLDTLPSGHIAVDILDFGPNGYVHPIAASEAGYRECDFRCEPGSDLNRAMFTTLLSSSVLSLQHGGPSGSFSASIQPPAGRCTNAPVNGGGDRQKKSLCTLEATVGQGVHGAGVGWAGRVGELMASTGVDRVSAFSVVLRAVGRVRARRSQDEGAAFQDHSGGGCGDMSPSWREAGNGRKSIRFVGDLPDVPQPMESAAGLCQGAQQEESFEGAVRVSALGHDEGREGDPREDQARVDAEVAAGPDKAHHGEQEGSFGKGSLEAGDGGVEERTDRAIRSSQVEDGAEGGFEDGGIEQHHDERVCLYGNGAEVRGVPGLLRWRDVSLGGGSPEVQGGDESLGRSAEDAAGLESEARAGRSNCFSLRDAPSQEDRIQGEGAELLTPGEAQVTGECFSSFVKMAGDGLKEKVECLRDLGYYEVAEVYLEEGGKWYEIENAEELEDERKCLLKVKQCKKLAMEDLYEDGEEIALSKKVKKQLRKCQRATEKVEDSFPVAVSEVYSPPRIVPEAVRQGLDGGGSYDIKTGFDLKNTSDLKKMWKELREDDPELTVLCPPCTSFSHLQGLNFPKMSFDKVAFLVGEGLHHVGVSAEVALWQYQRGKLFLFEHPFTSKAWKEEVMCELRRLAGVQACISDMCAYGMRVKGELLNRKTTMWLTNSDHIAKQLQKRCSGDHVHEPLMGGSAALAAVYPPSVCRAIVVGLKRHLQEKYGRCVLATEHENLVEVSTFAAPVEDAEDEDDGLDVWEDILPEEVGEMRRKRAEDRKEREEEQRRIQTAVTEEDKAKVAKMHKNLGHPSVDSFVRFLRAGRVREEVVRWTIKEFKCATCDAHALPKAPRPAVVPKCYRPGVAVGIDLFYIPDHENHRSVPVLNVVDLGTNYQVAELVANKEPTTIWRAFWSTWCRVFGVPQYVSMDEGREFRGDFAQWCAQHGTLVFRAAARAPWQQGKVERHGGLLKEMIEKARSTAKPETMEELRLLVQECECAKNRFSNRSGYSPVQRQIGQWPRVPGSLMSDESLDPALQVQNMTDEHERLLEFRRLAQEAFVKLNSKEAAARSLKARSRLQRIFKAGDVVYVFRVLRKRKTVRGHEAGAARGYGVGQRASWVGPGHVLAMEGSVVWVNMFGELWRASVEQTRDATTEERLGVEVVAEDFSEMQERLKRGSHRAGYRDVTADVPEDVEEIRSAEAREEDEVRQEGEERGRPRPRVESGGDGLDVDEDSDRPTPSTPRGEEDGQQRRLSQHTLAEPEAEIVEPSIVDEQQSIERVAEEIAHQSMEEAAAANQILDGVTPDYGAIRRSTGARWERRQEAPYFAEYFFQDEEEGAVSEDKEETKEPTQDYWVYDYHRGILQRHHVHWRRALFNPAAAEASPIPLRAIKKSRLTTWVKSDGEVEKKQDEWSLFSKREERFEWWKGITEFRVDEHYLQSGSTAGKKKRGEGEIFPHEIPAEEWPAWVQQDTEEFDKIVKSGGLRVLSVEESREVREKLKGQGKLNRILPSRMVRRYKPGEGPGAPRTRKSRFCIRGDRDPDAAFLSRFAPTVTTSNLQVLLQAAINKGYAGVVGDLKSAFTQSMPLFREEGPLYCKSCDGSMPGLETEQIAEIKLGCYGLCDAPLHWRKTLTQYLRNELGYKQSNLDPCTYLLHEGQNLHGMVAVEVDDLLMFGDAKHEEKMKQLQQRFVFGKLEPINEVGVSFNGRRLRQVDQTIFIDMQAFVEERMELVEISKERLKQRGEKLNEAEVSLVRRACGSLNWAGREGRPDAAAAASMFSSQLTEMKIENVVELNKALTRIKESSDLALQIQPIQEDRLRWGVITDASWGNARGGKTQGGHLLVVFDQEMLEGKTAVCNLLHWKSGKLQRTVNSTLAAETQALARGVGDLLWMMVMYMEITDPSFQLREWRKYVKKRGYTAFTKHAEKEELAGALAIVDAKSLYDLLAYETTGGTDRRTALDVQVLREELAELEGKIRWVDHLHMPADCLTKKQGKCEALEKLLRTGRFGITAESITLGSRLNERQQNGYNRR